MPGLWQTVCRKVEANELSIEACKRETTEETGLDLLPEKMKFIFNDRRYDCDVYVTKIRSDQQPKRTEPDKMSAWKPVTAEQYIDLAQLGSITDTHVRRYDQILEQIEQFEGNDQLDNWDEWNSWNNTNDTFRNGKPKLTNGRHLLKRQKILMKEPIIEKNGTFSEGGNIHVNDVEKRIIIRISYASNVIK